MSGQAVNLLVSKTKQNTNLEDVRNEWRRKLGNKYELLNQYDIACSLKRCVGHLAKFSYHKFLLSGSR